LKGFGIAERECEKLKSPDGVGVAVDVLEGGTDFVWCPLLVASAPRVSSQKVHTGVDNTSVKLLISALFVSQHRKYG
jgi:hypothetical protein